MVTQGKIKDRVSDTNWFIYALSLQEFKYYIGISVTPESRISQHRKQSKDSSSWCKKYKPKETIEIIDTGLKRMIDAHHLEDIYTLEYIEKYGSDNVRGGRYFGSNKKIKKMAKSHLERGYISIPHKLLQEYKITYSELIQLEIYDFVINSKNRSYMLHLLSETKNFDNNKKLLLEKITQAQL